MDNEYFICTNITQSNGVGMAQFALTDPKGKVIQQITLQFSDVGEVMQYKYGKKYLISLVTVQETQ